MAVDNRSGEKPGLVSEETRRENVEESKSDCENILRRRNSIGYFGLG
jgi:hypothetical protein